MDTSSYYKPQRGASDLSGYKPSYALYQGSQDLAAKYTEVNLG